MKVSRIVSPLVLSALMLSSLSSVLQASLPSSSTVSERPWEVIADNGDMVLPDLYYSENSENEQVMPLQVGGRHQIDHLVYPTIGNPKLYMKDNQQDSLMLVLRLEPAKLAALGAQAGTDGIRGRNLHPLTLNPSGGNSLRFFLVPREKRNGANDVSDSGSIAGRAGVIEITPNQIGIQPQYAGMPKAFMIRDTLRVYFDQAMKQIPEGLYDIRVETTISGQVSMDSTYNGVLVSDHTPSTQEGFTALNFSDAQVNTGWIFGKKATPHLGELVNYINSSTDPTVKNAKYVTFNGDLHDGGAVLQRYPRAVGEEYAKEAEVIFGRLKELRKPVFLTAGNHDGYVSMGHVPALIAKDNAALEKKFHQTSDPKSLNEEVHSDELKLFEKMEQAKPGLMKFDPSGMDTLETVVRGVIASGQSTWPNLSWENFSKYLSDTMAQQGGRHLDIFQGRHARTVGTDFSSWHPIATSKRNMVYYDGQYQWRKTYGPLYYDYSVGQNRFLSVNSFELRQHWRAGWGMYTVNYGGGVSPVQMDWIKRELARFAGNDVTMFAHHDPRGGHNGKDYPYFFGYVDYGSQMDNPGSSATQALRPDYYSNDVKCDLKDLAKATKEQRKECEDKWFNDKIVNAAFTKMKNALGDNGGFSYSMLNFAMGDTLEKGLCKGKPVADKDVSELGCMHDGLQEWMTRDRDFDCAPQFKASYVNADGTKAGLCQPGHSWYSAYELLNLITTNTNVRTLVLGHTHFNSIDQYQAGDELVPNQVHLSVDTLADLENSGPMRSGAIDQGDVSDKANVKVTYPFQRFLQNSPTGVRELVILRVTTAADLTSQYVGSNGKEPMYGFQALTFTSPSIGDIAGDSLNRVDFFRNKHDGKSGFEHLSLSSLNINRRAEMRAANGMSTKENCFLAQSNPLHYTFRLDKKETKDIRSDEQIINEMNASRTEVTSSDAAEQCK